MKLLIQEEFLGICNEILDRKISLEDWKSIESDDLFQSTNFKGGFDATEMEFTFSYYNLKAEEFWFQISLDDIHRVVQGFIAELDLRTPS